jgi:polyvinyl alcohol dehydrogenase (cytochrome)
MRTNVEDIRGGLRVRRAMVTALGGALLGAAGMLAGGCGRPDAPAPPRLGQWRMWGHDLHNTRWQPHETKISPASASDLAVAWVFTAGGDVSATPAVDEEAVYVPDWAGNLFKLDRHTGALRWKRRISDYNGVPDSIVRNTPFVHGDLLIFGDQAGRVRRPASVMAVNKHTGERLWITRVDDHPMSLVTQSPVVFDNRVYVGVSSHEETLSPDIPGYVCCTFRGSMLSLDARTGEILWRVYMTPEGYSGNAIWGSTPVIDAKRGSVYIATGNNYTLPEPVARCVVENMATPHAIQECFSPDNHFDSVMAMDLYTGAIEWVTRSIPFDAWTLGCILPELPGVPPCPEPSGPDFDFAQGPSLFTIVQANGQKRELLGAGQKSGKYWTFDPDTGAVVWDKQVGVGGALGGLQWGSATDGVRIYTAISNYDGKGWELNRNGEPTGQLAHAGVLSALDSETGTILWQTPTLGASQAEVTVANGVVFGCSVDPMGHMYALDAASGAILWTFASGGSCGGGAAVAGGMVYWGSGYSQFAPLGTTGNNKLYAFTVP